MRLTLIKHLLCIPYNYAAICIYSHFICRKTNSDLGHVDSKQQSSQVSTQAYLDSTDETFSILPSQPFFLYIYVFTLYSCKFCLLLMKRNIIEAFFCIPLFQVVSYCPHCLFIPPYKGSLSWLLDIDTVVLVKIEAAYFFTQ